MRILFLLGPERSAVPRRARPLLPACLFAACAAPPLPPGGDLLGTGADTLVIGAPFRDIGGRVYFCPGGPAFADPEIPLPALSVIASPDADDSLVLFGNALSIGDLDGDGAADLSIGSPGTTNLYGRNGGVYFYSGPLDPLPAPQSYLLRVPAWGQTATKMFGGWSFARGRFEEADRLQLLTGAPTTPTLEDPPLGGSGAVLLLPSPPLVGFPQQRLDQGTLDVNEPDDRLGISVATGDFDGNGWDDMAAGAPWESFIGIERAGAVYVRRSKANEPLTPWSQLIPMPLNELVAGAEFGHALAAGDFNGDGRTDLAVGAPGASSWVPSPQPADGASWAGDHAGQVFVYLGWNGGFFGHHSLHQHPVARDEAFDRFGHALCAADLDGDGFDDLAVGIPWKSAADAAGNGASAAPRTGAVMVFRGGDGGLLEDASWTLRLEDVLPHVNEGQFGYALAAGDYDGDGGLDLAVGVPASLPTGGIVKLPDELSAPPPPGALGRVVVYRWSSTGPVIARVLQEPAPGPDPQSGSFGLAIGS